MHQIEEQYNFNTQHMRRSYEDQIELWKTEARKSARLLEQALSRTGVVIQSGPGTNIKQPLQQQTQQQPSPPQQVLPITNNNNTNNSNNNNVP